jgi:transposase
MTDNSYKFYIGIDVSKAKLDIAQSNNNSLLQFSNTPEGLKELVKSLPAKKKTLIILEATGGYEKFAANHLRKRGYNAAVVNAKRVRKFAQAAGKYAKTDGIDAKVIMEFGKAFNPNPQPLMTDEQDEQQQNINRRAQLVRMIAMEKQHLEHAGSSAKSINKHLCFLEKELNQVEGLLQDQIAQDPVMSEKLSKLNEIKGVGKVVAMNLLIHLPELGKISSKEISALAGVVPYNKDSGQSKGKREIAGGRAAVRTALYMAILTACKFNPAIKKFYDRLIAKGKLKKVAMVACMRKLIVIVNAMLRDNTSWDPSRF